MASFFSDSAERGMGNSGRIVCVLDRVSPKPLRNFYTFLYYLASLGRHSRCAISAPFFFAAPLPRSSPPLSSFNSFNRCFPGAISAATCCAIPTHGFLAPLSRHIHCVVATHLSTSPPPPWSPHPLRNFNVCLLIAALRRRKC